MWISNRYFTDGVSFDDITKVRHKYEDGWETAITLLNNRNKISPNAIKLTKRLKADLDIEVFPSIYITAIKGWKSQGVPNFAMVTKDGSQCFFFDTPRKYLAKESKLVESDCSGDIEIYVE